MNTLIWWHFPIKRKINLPKEFQLVLRPPKERVVWVHPSGTPRWIETSLRILGQGPMIPQWVWILKFKKATLWSGGGSRKCPLRWRWAKYHKKMNNLINLLIIKSFGGKMADNNTPFQIHSKIRFKEVPISMAMTCFRTWLWATIQIETFWAVVPRKIQMRWTSRACFRRAPRAPRIWMFPYPPVTLLPGKYNLNHRLLRLYLKYRLRSIRSSRVQSDSNQRCRQQAW